MKKRKVKVISLIIAIAVIIGTISAIGYAEFLENGEFNTNPPTHITPNSKVIGSIDNTDDRECYMLDIENDGAFTVSLIHDNMFDLVKCGYYITVYKMVDKVNENGKTVKDYIEIAFFRSFWSKETDDGSVAQEIVSTSGEIGVSKGTYLIVVEPGTSILKYDFILQTSFTKSSVYEKEPNNTKETANEFSLGRAFYASSTEYHDGTDIDWYKFTLTSDQCIELIFNHSDMKLPSAGWNIKLLNDNGDIISEFRSLLSDTVNKTGSIGLRPGDYYIVVEAQTVVVDTYSIILGYNDAVNSEFELNDTVETATELPEGVTFTGSLTERLLDLDKDYYTFTLENDSVIDIYFEHPEIEGDKDGWNITLYRMAEGELQQIVKKTSAWNSKGLGVEYLGLAAGEYYLSVDADAVWQNSTTYRLTWNYNSSENINKNTFETEPNGTVDTAEVIDFNTVYYGAIISSDVDFDEDYYKFTLDGETNVSLELGHDKLTDSGITWIANIIDEEGNVVKVLESSKNEGLVTIGVMTLKEGTYYIKLETGLYGSEIPYYFRMVR